MKKDFLSKEEYEELCRRYRTEKYGRTRDRIKCVTVAQRLDVQENIRGIVLGGGNHQQAGRKVHGFSHKNPKTNLKNVDPVAQKRFVNEYKEFVKNTLEDEPILLMDAVHPTMNMSETTDISELSENLNTISWHFSGILCNHIAEKMRSRINDNFHILKKSNFLA
ncbi:MAG: hypothetical protein LBJ19_00195 [Holosporaceae bacterium]|jgi:hypothetical protein|nr:hypothetical protein [Holosporaceae bacterium]